MNTQDKLLTIFTGFIVAMILALVLKTVMEVV